MFMWASMCRHMHMHVCRDWKCQDLLEVQSQAVMRCSLLVLERKLESSAAAAAHAPNRWTAVPVQRTGKRKGVLGNFTFSSPWIVTYEHLDHQYQRSQRKKCGGRIKQTRSQMPRGPALPRDSGQERLWNARGDRRETKTDLHLDSSLESRVRKKDRRPSSRPSHQVLCTPMCALCLEGEG